MQKLLLSLALTVIIIIIYFFTWPVPVEPVSWQAPPYYGYTGDHAVNNRLAAIELLSIGNTHGPEDIAIDIQGRIVVSTHDGTLVRLDADGRNPHAWINTGGRPLGIMFDSEDKLIVADAYKGLLSINSSGEITVLASEADGRPILYANNFDIASNGDIYFSDASKKFGAEAWGGSYPASLLDLMEHGSHGRVLKYEKATGQVHTLLEGLNFANGIALSHDQQSLLINETGGYRVLRLWIKGEKSGQLEDVITALPAFPDNLNRGLDGRYWIGLVSPRNVLLDGLSDKPFLRKVVQRLPTFIRPKATAYGHVIAINDAGEVVVDLQDPQGKYPINTGAFETEEFLYVGSLMADKLGRGRTSVYR